MNTRIEKAAPRGTALVTGASAGIGAAYADRLSARGYDLILVARNAARLASLADRLTARTNRSIETIAADLRDKHELARIEDVLNQRKDITLLVNNAGIGAPTPLLDNDVARLEQMINLNVIALMRLTYAAVPGFVERAGGAIISIASIVGIAPELLNGVYGGTKAFVLAFSRALHGEFGEKGLRVQVVLPGATATDFWPLSGTAIENLPTEIVMSVDHMVDAALSGFDQGELVTIPALSDLSAWQAFEAARQNLLPKLSRSTPADRYGVVTRI